MDQRNIIARLQQEILPLQGFKPVSLDAAADVRLGPMDRTFPNRRFPTGAVHEFLSSAPEQSAATAGFVSAIAGMLMQKGGVGIWIGCRRTIFPPALKAFGIDPQRMLFVDLLQEKELLWVMEEALRTEGLAAVICESPGLDFTASRRLQLAVEKSRVTGFVLRHTNRSPGTVACVTRWRITPLPSRTEEGMPGIGFLRWNVSLLKVRNGQPGSWDMEWREGSFRGIVPDLKSLSGEQRRKTG